MERPSARGEADYSVSARRRAPSSRSRGRRGPPRRTPRPRCRRLTQAFARRMGDRHDEGGAEADARRALGREEREPGFLELREQALPQRLKEASTAASISSGGVPGARRARRAARSFCLSSSRSKSGVEVAPLARARRTAARRGARPPARRARRAAPGTRAARRTRAGPRARVGQGRGEALGEGLVPLQRGAGEGARRGERGGRVAEAPPGTRRSRARRRRTRRRSCGRAAPAARARGSSRRRRARARAAAPRGRRRGGRCRSPPGPARARRRGSGATSAAGRPPGGSRRACRPSRVSTRSSRYSTRRVQVPSAWIWVKRSTVRRLSMQPSTRGAPDAARLLAVSGPARSRREGGHHREPTRRLSPGLSWNGRRERTETDERNGQRPTARNHADPAWRRIRGRVRPP